MPSTDPHRQDRAHVWHPYTRRTAQEDEALPMIVRGEGIHLVDDQGRRWVDAISSWWCMALGHGHPALVEAIRAQAGVLQHSILGNLSHPGAAELAARLAHLMPTPDRHVLFASDGASAIEQALKIAVQYHYQTGQTGRTRFACLQDGYHGDTLGAMSMGYLEHFHRPFHALLLAADRLPFPIGDDFAPARDLLDRHADEYHAVIVEPLCQGAAGMRMYSPAWLRQLGAWCRDHRVLLIVDEIATGFGRTGSLFAFEQAGIDPDLVCVGKALTAGCLPLSATIAKDALYETFHADTSERTLQHGHTFCGNPIAVAAALAALAIYTAPGWLEEVRRKAALLAAGLQPLAGRRGVRDVRCLGMIGAVELEPEPQALPGQNRAHRMRRWLWERGILLRPLGSTIYLMPPLIIDDPSLRELIAALEQALDATA